MSLLGYFRTFFFNIPIPFAILLEMQLVWFFFPGDRMIENYTSTFCVLNLFDWLDINM